MTRPKLLLKPFTTTIIDHASTNRIRLPLYTEIGYKVGPGLCEYTASGLSLSVGCELMQPRGHLIANCCISLLPSCGSQLVCNFLMVQKQPSPTLSSLPSIYRFSPISLIFILPASHPLSFPNPHPGQCHLMT